MKYFACIKEDPVLKNSDVEVLIEWKGIVNHELIAPTKRISGEERKLLGLKSQAIGCYNLKNEILTNEKNDQISISKLRKIKFESDHRNRISNDFFVDLNACKRNFDTLCKTESFDGFLQEISIHPFGVLLMCELQLKIWKKIKVENPIWFFDATGSVVKNLNSKKS